MPPRKTKTRLPTRVEAITHADKRANLPTADAQNFVAPELEQPAPVRYPRDPSLDPQLAWKGKDELDGEDLVADAPPIYIQEKIDPRVLVENLRNTAASATPRKRGGRARADPVRHLRRPRRARPGRVLPPRGQLVQPHDPRRLAERDGQRGRARGAARQGAEIYIDPPYGIKFGSNWQVSTRKRDVKDGKRADASREVEQIKAFRDTWELGIHSYLTYLRDRLTVAKDLLTESGSVFVQIGDENVHLVRSLMDEVFGSENFCSIITLTKAASQSAYLLASVNDFVLWYARDQLGSSIASCSGHANELRTRMSGTSASKPPLAT